VAQTAQKDAAPKRAFEAMARGRREYAAKVHKVRDLLLAALAGAAHYNLGRLLPETGAADTAIAEYRRALEIRPDLAEARLSLGQALGDAGRLDAAISEFRQVLRLRPGHAEAQKNLDLALAMKSRGGR
jgi:tetratricopeptide (TPR) repeat protein